MGSFPSDIRPGDRWTEAARAELVAAGVDATPIDVQAWGIFTTFADPDGNRCTVQELPAR